MFGFMLSLADLGSDLVLEVNTITVQIYRLLCFGDVQASCALASLLIIAFAILSSVFTAFKRKCHV